MNARIRRQVRGVICHRLMVLETLDQAQAMALDEKAQTQAGFAECRQTISLDTRDVIRKSVAHHKLQE